MQRAMASENFSINIFFSNCNLDISIINLPEKKCENFVNVKVTLVKYHYDSNAGFIAWNMLSDTRSVKGNSSCVFLVSKMFLESVWCTKHKEHVLQFMLKPQSLIILTDDVTRQVLQKHSTQLLHRNTSKLPVQSLKHFTVTELEPYFIEHLLMPSSMGRFEVGGKYCVQEGQFV